MRFNIKVRPEQILNGSLYHRVYYGFGHLWADCRGPVSALGEWECLYLL